MTHNNGPTKNIDNQYDPRFLNNGTKPLSRTEVNAAARYYFNNDPDINRIINQQALFLSNCFDITELHKCITSNIKNTLEEIIREYFIAGEVFIYAELDTNTKNWSSLIIQNPDYVIVKKTVTGSSIFLRPDENIRRIVFSDKAEDIGACKLLDSNLINTIKNRENILLDDFNISHITNRCSQYDIRGVSFLQPLFGILQKQDRSEDDTLKLKTYLLDGSLVNDLVLQRTLVERNDSIAAKLENWINKKLIEPIAKINGYLDVPKAKFNLK